MEVEKYVNNMPRELAGRMFDTLKECKADGLERSDVIRKVCEDDIPDEYKKTIIGIYKYVMDVIHY